MGLYRSFVSAAAAAIFGGAAAAQSLTVETNTTRPLTLRQDVGGVAIGNPDIADVAVLDARQLLITGRTFGVTNLIVFDKTGRRIYAADVVVPAQGDGMVTLNRGNETSTLSCNGACAPIVNN